ncbi:unnamed protein product [Rotaria sp. Silwood1]|nr:unnamed protein product [Rotaria sp. Silwood1]
MICSYTDITHESRSELTDPLSILLEARFEPCQVCGEQSSGLHCGAITCEACKKFFLRSINGEDQKYKCVRNKDCIITRNNRTQCQYCRFQKCKTIGMTVKEGAEIQQTPRVADIFAQISCYVCQAPSSGIHFGAITCEGCKGFFRRSIKERAPSRYKCMDNGTCEINVATRNACRYCRFQRCIKVGSRIGRQSNLFKHHMQPLSAIKFAAYRVACKLRILQKYLKLTYVDYNILVRAFNTHQLHFGVETSIITYENARKVLTAIYQLISSYHFNESTMDEVIDTLLRLLCEILHIKIDEDFDLNAFKIILFALSNAKLPEKYRCFFRQITSPNVIASQGKLNELFEILLKLPNHFDNVDSFHPDNIPGCVQSCLDHTHDGIIREDIFVNWMGREPQTLVWLPTLHRLIATETGAFI